MADTKNERGWNLYPRDGQWILSHKVSGDAKKKWREHRVPRDIRTRRDAERYAATWIDAYRSADPAAPAAAAEKPVTIRSLAEDWLSLCEKNPKLSPGTKCQYRTNLPIHVLAYPEIADAPIAEVGSGALRAWLRKVRDHGKVTIRWEKGENGRRVRKLLREGAALAPFTCRNVVNTLTAFYEDVIAEEWVSLPANPMRHPGVRKEVPAGESKAGRNVVLYGRDGAQVETLRDTRESRKLPGARLATPGRTTP